MDLTLSLRIAEESVLGSTAPVRRLTNKRAAGCCSPAGGCLPTPCYYRSRGACCARLPAADAGQTLDVFPVNAMPPIFAVEPQRHREIRHRLAARTPGSPHEARTSERRLARRPAGYRLAPTGAWSKTSRSGPRPKSGEARRLGGEPRPVRADQSSPYWVICNGYVGARRLDPARIPGAPQCFVRRLGRSGLNFVVSPDSRAAVRSA